MQISAFMSGLEDKFTVYYSFNPHKIKFLEHLFVDN